MGLGKKVWYNQVMSTQKTSHIKEQAHTNQCPKQRAPIAAVHAPHDLMHMHAHDVLSSPGMKIEARCIQHGTTSVLEHSLRVCHMCIKLAQRTGIPVHQRELIRGALLHDYFLYDWHDPDPSHRLHGFRHPKRAAQNAARDFKIGAIEHNMIVHHMFPLTPAPPTCREAILLCVADKIVATQETVAGFVKKHFNSLTH